MAVGHIYYFLEDVFPNQPGGMKLLKTPRILRILCDGETDDDVAYQPLPEGDRPGLNFDDILRETFIRRKCILKLFSTYRFLVKENQYKSCL